MTKLEVVNALGERGVKDIHDYANTARDWAYKRMANPGDK